jgi:hypothetical protein
MTSNISKPRDTQSNRKQVEEIPKYHLQGLVMVVYEETSGPTGLVVDLYGETSAQRLSL